MLTADAGAALLASVLNCPHSLEEMLKTCNTDLTISNVFALTFAVEEVDPWRLSCHVLCLPLMHQNIVLLYSSVQ